MLYDPKWEKYVATPSVEGFKAWLERQNQNERFCYESCDNCAVGQYLASLGKSWRTTMTPITTTLNAFAYAAKQKGTPTFGAVLHEIEMAS